MTSKFDIEREAIIGGLGAGAFWLIQYMRGIRPSWTDLGMVGGAGIAADLATGTVEDMVNKFLPLRPHSPPVAATTSAIGSSETFMPAPQYVPRVRRSSRW